MKIGKIFQKVKDLYGWDKSQLYYYKDKRDFNKVIADGYRRKMAEAKNVKEFKKNEFMFQKYNNVYERANSFVENHGEEFDVSNIGWRKERKD